MFTPDDVVFSYTRKQAIEDGLFIDVSTTAREAGFRLPMVITQDAWADFVAWDDEDTKRQTYQDEAGRLWDVLWMAFLAAAANRERREIIFEFLRVPRGGRGQRPRKVKAKLILGPGDEGEPVFTIMLPSED